MLARNKLRSFILHPEIKPYHILNKAFSDFFIRPHKIAGIREQQTDQNDFPSTP